MMEADAEGEIYLISVTGYSYRHPVADRPAGVTLGELQDIADFLGLINAGNLDGGGGSTSMVIEGKVVDFPHFKVPDDNRRVGESILIIDEES